MRASPSYVYRLVKYAKRGFGISLPAIHKSDVDEEEIYQYFSRINDAYQDYMDEQEGSPGYSDFRLKQSIKGRIAQQLKPYIKGEVLMVHVSKLGRLLEDGVGDGINRDWSANQMFNYAREAMNSVAITDPASILILAAFRGFLTTPEKVSDYTTQLRRTGVKSDQFIFDPSLLSWKSQDPMSQVTSTFHPTPVKNLRDWYSRSPFYLGVSRE